MSKITMYDMGFGDAHILEREGYNEVMLVDCGSLNPTKANVDINSIPYIKNEIGKKEMASFLLTHFHTDHYKQLSKLLNNSFDKIYLRNVYDSKVTIYRSIYELMYFAKKSQRWNNALNTILSVPNLTRLLKPSGVFVFVRKGSTFKLNNEKYEVYKPDVLEMHFDPIEFDEETANEFVNELLESVISLRNLVLEYSHENDADGTSVFYNEVTLGNLKSTFDDNVGAIKRIVDEYNSDLSDGSKRKLRDFINGDNEHKYNIVFGLKSDDNDRHLRLLMCGDGYPEDVEDVISSNGITEIDVMKVPHHGTPRYYPNLTNITITNALIPYSYPTNVYPGTLRPKKVYIIDSRYGTFPYTGTPNGNSPYTNVFTPKKELNY